MWIVWREILELWQRIRVAKVLEPAAGGEIGVENSDVYRIVMGASAARWLEPQSQPPIMQHSPHPPMQQRSPALEPRGEEAAKGRDEGGEHGQRDLLGSAVDRSVGQG